MTQGANPSVLYDAKREVFFARFHVGGKRKLFTLATKAEGADQAAGKLRQLLAETGYMAVHVATPTRADATTFHQLAAAYIAERKAEGRVGKRHLYDREWNLRKLAEFTTAAGVPLGDLPLSALTRDHLIDFLATAEAHGWSRTTRHHAADAARVLTRWAVRVGHVPLDPWASVPRPGQDLAPKRIVTKDELQAIIGAAKPRGRVALIVAYETAARPSELCRARWEHVQGDVIVLTEHKTAHHGKPARQLILTRAAQAALAEIPAPHSGPIFRGGNGKPLAVPGVSTMLKNAIARIKDAPLRKRLADVHPYSLRHSRATHMIQDGADPKTVADVLGNGVGIVLATYTWPSADHVRAAAERSSLGNW